MEAPKQFAPPEYWQTFETLCKKLWEEIWQCPETQKNGRSGQTQHGVDVFGYPKGEIGYYGIQCKGKDNYTHAQLTKKEVDKEIEKAKLFEPDLVKFYFATTAIRDAKIQAYVRKKNIESQQNGGFEIHLFSWEDIVEKLTENPSVLDWYLNIQNYRKRSDVEVTFENGENELEVTVPFYNSSIRYEWAPHPKPRTLPIPVFELGKGLNKSYYGFKIMVKNTGNTPIDNPKLRIYVEGNIQSIKDCVPFDQGGPMGELGVKLNDDDVFIINESTLLEIRPITRTFPLKEEYRSKGIYIKPLHAGSEIVLNWEFLSNQITRKGSLKVVLNTNFIPREIVKKYHTPVPPELNKILEDFYEK